MSDASNKTLTLGLHTSFSTASPSSVRFPQAPNSRSTDPLVLFTWTTPTDIPGTSNVSRSCSATADSAGVMALLSCWDAQRPAERSAARIRERIVFEAGTVTAEAQDVYQSATAVSGWNRPQDDLVMKTLMQSRGEVSLGGKGER